MQQQWTLVTGERKCRTTAAALASGVAWCAGERTNPTRTAGAAVFLLAASFSCSPLVRTYPLRSRSAVDSIRKSKSRRETTLSRDDLPSFFIPAIGQCTSEHVPHLRVIGKIRRLYSRPPVCNYYAVALEFQVYGERDGFNNNRQYGGRLITHAC